MMVNAQRLQTRLEAARLAMEQLDLDRQSLLRLRDEAQVKIDNLEDALKRSNGKIDQSRSELAEITKIVTKLEQANAVLVVERDQLQDSIRIAQEANKIMERQQAIHVQRGDQLLEDKNALETRFAEQIRKVEVSENEARASYVSLIADVKQREAVYDNQREALQRGVREARQAYTALAGEMQAGQASHTAQVASLETQLLEANRFPFEALAKGKNRITGAVRGARSSIARVRQRIASASLALARRCKKIIVVSLPRRAFSVVKRALAGTLDGTTRFRKNWRMRFGTPRTMWGVTPILTLPLLVRCDQLLGLRSQSLVFTTYYITQNFDINLKRLCDWVHEKHPHYAPLMYRVFLRIAMARYDIYHLFCDRSILLPSQRMEINPLEMAALKDRGHKLYSMTYGADVRTRERTLAQGKYNFCSDCPEPGVYCQCDDEQGKANMDRISQSATAMLAMGDMVDHAPGSTKMHFWPLDMQKIKYVGTDWTPKRTLRVAHAPNHSHFKGSRYLEKAIERLRAEGHDIELVRVSGVSNKEAMELFRSSDIVADQFIGGAPGYTAFEAMALGKPVLCYLRNRDMVVDPDRCPIINTWPDTIFAVLKACLEEQFDLAELGCRGRNYAERNSSLEAVAISLGHLYLETAGFPARIERRIQHRVSNLEAAQPAALAGHVPVSWRSAAVLDRAGPMAISRERIV